MESKVLRMEFYELPHCMKLRMEGRVVQDFAEHARTLIGDSPLPSKLIVDLSDVNYVDAVGEEVLLWFKKIGVTFTAESAYSLHVCERLQLPVESQLSASSHSGHHGTRGHAQRCRPSREPSNAILQGETHI
jgi:hypothetical protein